MPRVKTTPPEQSREKGERNIHLPLYIPRIPLAPFSSVPRHLEQKRWRQLVQNQPVAVACRETLVSNVLALDWLIEPKDSTQRDELKDEIEYYTDFFTDTGEWEYSQIIEWICKDALDLPFGAAAELGYIGDSPSNRLVWIQLLDGATLFPYPNTDWPVGQSIGGKVIYFPKHSINRVYFSPLTNIEQYGWGLAPPEKIFYALDLISKGDMYYAKLLLDTPEVGILDLIDMAKDSAAEWVEAWREMLTGIDPFKIPVLYEHEKKAEWIPFTKSPTEIMFDKAVNRYASLVCSGYGVSLSDIGLGGGSASGGDTLAGTIRDERKTKRTGFAVLKRKVEYFFNRMLPKTLRFKLIDLDDEISVALGRARLANATAFGAYINNGVVTPEEARQQAIADGLFSISMPEELPEELKDFSPNKNPAERPSMLGRPVSPGQGGFGEVAARSDVLQPLRELSEASLKRLMYAAYPMVSVGIMGVIEAFGEEDFNLLGEIQNSLWTTSGESPIQTLIQDSFKYSRKNMEKVEPKELFALEWNRLKSDVFDVVESSYKDAISKGMEELYVLGELDRIEKSIELEDVSATKDKIEKAVDEFKNTVKEFFYKSVVSGLYDYGLKTSELSVDNLILDNKSSIIVRDHVNVTCDALTIELANKISDIIVGEMKG